MAKLFWQCVFLAIILIWVGFDLVDRYFWSILTELERIYSNR